MALEQRDRQVIRVLALVFMMNILVAVAKLILGIFFGFVSLLADGLHSSLDAASNIVGWVGISMAARPPDDNHPYGHRRYEAIAGAIIGVFIALGLLEILRHAYAAWQNHSQRPEFHPILAVFVATTIVIGLAVGLYEKRQGTRLQSRVLHADAFHTLSDMFGSAVVLLSMIFVKMGLVWADIVGALIIAAIIARTAWHVISSNIGELTDQVRLDPEVIRSTLLQIEGIRGAHKIRSRGTGSRIWLDLHIHVDPQMSVEEAHRLTHLAIDTLKKNHNNLSDVIIHTEPADGRQNMPLGQSQPPRRS